jgi:hypothetical protein
LITNPRMDMRRRATHHFRQIGASRLLRLLLCTLARVALQLTEIYGASVVGSRSRLRHGQTAAMSPQSLERPGVLAHEYDLSHIS